MTQIPKVRIGLLVKDCVASDSGRDAAPCMGIERTAQIMLHHPAEGATTSAQERFKTSGRR
jgi:hypothetical protein